MVHTDIVFRRVSECLSFLVGGSGHVAALDPRKEQFRVTAVSHEEARIYRFTFEGLADRDSEFDAPPSKAPAPGLPISGYIDLDIEGQIQTNPDGTVRMGPWRVLAQGLPRRPAPEREAAGARPAPGPTGTGTTAPLTPEEIDDLLGR